MCNSGKAVKQGQGELRECSQTSHSTQSINSHSLPDPDPKLTHMKAAKREGWQQVTPIPFLNPDPIACLVGHSNEAPVVIDRQEVTALIDLAPQVLSISAQFCKELTLHIQPLGQLLELEGMGGCSHPIPQICGGKPPDSGDKKL